MHRLYAYTVSALTLAIVAWPATRSLEDDGFPLSTYPMFAYRKGRVAEVTSALAVADDGHSEPIPPRYIANAETMQAIRTLRGAVLRGRRESLELCRAIAGRIATARAPELRGARHVEIVTGRVDTIDYLAGHAMPSTRQLHARCDVERQAP